MNFLRIVGICFLIILSKLIPFNWIVGSYYGTFSCTTMMAPVIASQFGFGWMSLFFIHQKLLSATSLASIGFVLLYRAPLLFAAFAFKQKSLFFSIIVPIVCMILFVSHSVGAGAWMYTLYWLIPMVLFFVPDSIIFRSLSSSFIAHAVGSVIWLYCADIATSVWIALIPVVFFERLLMAVGMIGLQYGIAKIRQSVLINAVFSSKLLGFA